MRSSFLFLVLMVCSAPVALAEQHGCCDGCGHSCRLQPVCRLICEEKTITEVCYDCRCEDFCVMGPSKKCGHVCETDGCGQAHKRILWSPSCGHVRHRHVLVKVEIPRKAPHYKCVVEYVCPSCCRQCGRLPCEQVGALNSQAETLNAAAEMQTPAVANIAAEPLAEAAATPIKRSPFWQTLFK